MRSGSRLPGLCPARFQYDNCFLSSYPLGHPPEPPRINNGFETEENDVGGFVLLPVLKQIIHGDVRVVADTDEAGETEIHSLCSRHYRNPKSSAFRGEGHSTGWRKNRRKGGIEVHGRIKIHDSEAIRPDEANP